jgi:hypothetical protein
MSFLSVNSSDEDAHLTDLKLLCHAVIELFQDTFRNDWNVAIPPKVGRSSGVLPFSLMTWQEDPLARRAALFTL